MVSNKETISRLKFIGKIQKGEKINVRNLQVQPDSFLTSLSRTFFNVDNRLNTLHFVQETINRSFEILNTYECSTDDSEKIMYTHLIHDLNNAKIGLINLKETYAYDRKVCCDLQVLLEIIDAKMLGKNITNVIPESDLQQDNIMS